MISTTNDLFCIVVLCWNMPLVLCSKVGKASWQFENLSDVCFVPKFPPIFHLLGIRPRPIKCTSLHYPGNSLLVLSCFVRACQIHLFANVTNTNKWQISFFVKFIFCKYFEHKRHINYIKMQISQQQVRAVAHSQLRKQLDTVLFCVHLFTSIFGHS